MTSEIIQVENIHKAYGAVQAVNGLSFTVHTGEIFGLLGPNGAGKSTTLSILQGARRADAGRVTLFGLDNVTHAGHIKARIGVQLQRTSLLPDLTVQQQVELLAHLYRRALTPASVGDLLARVSLADKARALPTNLSGGQQQRLALCLALVNDPEIVFLDEPTAGLDPQARRALWELMQRLRAEGRTVILTTHYIEEAEALCDRVGIIDGGKLLALDTPAALTRQLLPTASPATPAGRATNLEDVFLRLTGRALRES